MKNTMLNILKLNLNKSKNIINNTNIEKSTKHFPSPVREWDNSIYVYNKNALKLIPSITVSAYDLLKSYFDLFNQKIERKMRTKRLLLRLRRLSSNKIFVSNGEFKHTNNKVIITIYLFNRQKHSYINIMKKLHYFKFYDARLNKNTAKKIVKRTKLKILQFLNIARKNRSVLVNLSIKNNLKSSKFRSYKNLCNYIDKFYRNFSKKCFMQIKNFFYYKQLMYINKTKYSYTYLKYLKNYLGILYKKNVEFNLVNIKRFYLNSDILSESIALKLTKNRRRIVKILKNLRKKVKIRIKKLVLNKPSEDNKLKINMTKKIYLNKFVTSSLKYRHVTGFRLETRGRLTRRYTASRSVTKFKYKGNLLNTDSSYKGLSSVLLKGNLRSNVQYTKLKSKTRIGSFGIKGWVSGN